MAISHGLKVKPVTGGGSVRRAECRLSTSGLDLADVSQFRRCSRPGCGKPAVATLTYAYAESTAVVGPLAATSEPHSWDLCEHHAEKITAPLGWELLRVDDITIDDDDDDLTALAKAVREAVRHPSGLVADSPATEYRSSHPVHNAKQGTDRNATKDPSTRSGKGERGHLRLVSSDED